jgi:ribosomal protein L11 methyltransferase
VDLDSAGDELVDRLIEAGAIDVDHSHTGAIAALMPDGVSPEQLRTALGRDDISIAAAVGRDDGSIWVLRPRAIRVGGVDIVPADSTASGALRLVDGPAFGTGLHPTTALCLEAIEELVRTHRPASLLDVGTGSGVLALAALAMSVSRAVGIDIDDRALEVAAANARLNGLDHRLELRRGGPAAVAGQWPIVVANVLAAPLIEMAPALVQRTGHHGHVLLSGIPVSLGEEVEMAYRRLGMRRVRVTSRAGWSAVLMRTSW